ncbi:carnitine palmitoyltransferase 2 [Rhodnius prolixus]
MMNVVIRQSLCSVNAARLSAFTVRFSSQNQNEDYQYLQKSSVPTLHFQKSLPRLPIPELEDSCKRYICAQQPLVDDTEMTQIVKNVNKMLKSDGPPLQKELKAIDAANRHTSYISRPWFDMYLTDRKPLPINYNPFLVFIDDPKPEYNHQLIRSANMVISSLRFMKSLRANLLEPEVFHLNPNKSNTKFFRTVTGMLPPAISWYGAYLFKAFPLDMSQYENLFNTSRIPKTGKDTLFHDNTTRHIIVMRGGHFFKVDVLDESGNILNAQDIYTGLDYILKEPYKAPEFPLGVLTVEERNTWATARSHLENTGNAEVLKVIDSAIFCLILDESQPTRDYKELIRQYLHSDGTNRWFDKSFSLIVLKNGVSGLNFEHSWGDGVAVLRYFEDIYKDSTLKPHIHPDTKPSSQNAERLVTPLKFQLDDKSKNFITEALIKYKKITDSLDINLLEFLDFGRNTCKKHKVSPDSIMQLAFQIAHYKLNKRFVSTYESCSTAAFKHGRTETMRPCTVETKAVCLDISSKDKPAREFIVEKIKKCSALHGQLIKEAAMGQGFDRHLFALRVLAEKNGKVPELYTDPAFSRLNHYVLSTSTLNSDALMLGAFGPVVPDGYGIGYSIWNDRLGSIVSNYRDHSDGAGYIQCLEQALRDLYDCLK